MSLSLGENDAVSQQKYVQSDFGLFRKNSTQTTIEIGRLHSAVTKQAITALIVEACYDNKYCAPYFCQQL